MTECAAAGVGPLQFWRMTYREIFHTLKGEGERRHRNRSLALAQAWWTEAFARSKRLPPLEPLLRKLDPPRVMSPAEQRAAIIGMAKVMGAHVIYRKKGEA